MTPPLVPSFTYIEASAPLLEPMAAYEVSDEAVRLGLAGSGSIEVTRTGISVLAPDSLSYERTIDRLGEWAQGQWLAAHGFRVMRGAVVARHGKAMAIVGGHRCGASVLALVLSRTGWGLISDGLVVLDKFGYLRALDPTVTLDAEATVGMPPDVRIVPLTTSRDRVRVTTSGHHDTELGAYVFLSVKQSLHQLIFGQVPFAEGVSTALEDFRVRSLLASAALPPPIVEAPVWRIARPMFSPDPLSSSPLTLAAMLTSAMDPAENR